MISYFRDDRLCEADSFLSVVKPDYTECPMIAAVGAGGKTSTLRRLAEEAESLLFFCTAAVPRAAVT